MTEKVPTAAPNRSDEAGTLSHDMVNRSTLSQSEAMLTSGVQQPVRRPRLLMVAFVCHPHESMESRLGWNRCISAARSFETTVLYSGPLAPDRMYEMVPTEKQRSNITFHQISMRRQRYDGVLSDWSFYRRYGQWFQDCFNSAKQFHAEHPYDLLHLVNLCGYRETGSFHKLAVPFVWGPVGGTHNFPIQFIRLISLSGAICELSRNLMNALQLRASLKVRHTAKKAAVVFAANRETQRDLLRVRHCESTPLLEYGHDLPEQSPKPFRDPTLPLKILWTGRMRDWKGLPILLHALARSKATFNYELNVVGDGNCKASWQKLAQGLQIADRVKWHPWPEYGQLLPHFAANDVFAFTSLRDTSGTGLVEALVYGLPIIGLNHQGARDIMHSSCSIRIPTTSIEVATHEFSVALKRLASDSIHWKQLSDGARLRSKLYHWNYSNQVILRTYERVLLQNHAGQSPELVSPEHSLPTM